MRVAPVTGRLLRSQPARRGLTLLELLVVVAIIAILVGIATVNVQRGRTRAQVSASKSNMRVLAGALEVYHVDHGAYPEPMASLPQDPFGVVSSSALRGLTTPVAYVSQEAFHDPFGTLQIQTSVSRNSAGGSPGDPFAPPTPGFNGGQSLLYFYYPRFGELIGDETMSAPGFGIVSVGPDRKDSFIAYYPFPSSLPAGSDKFGILQIEDTIYDPTNGTVSGGDLAAFGGEIAVKRLIGGGDF